MKERLHRATKRLEPAGAVLLISGLLALIPFPTCLLRLGAGIPCPACGLTRAGLSLLRADLSASYHYHPLALPFTLLFGVSVFAAYDAPEVRWRRFVQGSTAIAGIALMLVWGLRFLGFFGGPVPP